MGRNQGILTWLKMAQSDAEKQLEIIGQSDESYQQSFMDYINAKSNYPSSKNDSSSKHSSYKEYDSSSLLKPSSTKQTFS